MRRPIQSTIDTGNGSPRRRTAIIGSVVALHVLLGYAIVSGLAQRIVLAAPNTLTAEILPPKKDVPPPTEPLPLMPEMLIKPSVPTAPAPVIRVAPTKPVQSITVIQGPPRPVVSVPAPVLQATPSQAEPVPPIIAAPTAARGIAGTHTIPPYPDLARRLGQSGTVRLEIVLDATGAVRAVTVQRSSGSDTLDAAATAWVFAHWRYAPATRDGQAVMSLVLADVVFDLKHAG